MYQVSDAYKKAIKENARKFLWSGEIIRSDGTKIRFADKDIVKGSGYINRKCCADSEIELGSVYAAECGITLLTDIDRYSLDKATISFTFSLKLEDGSFEDVPMGVFDITEANRNIRTLEIKGYDAMLRFDRAFSSTLTGGTAFDLLSFACDECKVKLKHTKNEIEEMPNGKEILGIYSENDIETYRDLIYYVAQALAGFAVINRNGELEICHYTDNSVDEISVEERFASSISDFITRYTAISSTNVQTQTSEYMPLEVDDGLTLNLGPNPLLQYGLEETRKNVLTNILNQIVSIDYVPFDSTTISNPALDIGDVIRLTGGQADGHITAITSIDTKINGRQTLKCVGKNPRLSEGKSKNEKNLIGLMNQIKTKDVVFYAYTNSRKYTVSGAETVIASIEFTASTDTYAQFLAQILLEVTSDDEDRLIQVTRDNEEESYAVKFSSKRDVNVIFRYYLNGLLIESYMPQERLSEGKHTMALYYPFASVTGGQLYTFNVTLTADSGEVSIDKEQVQGSVFGQGLLATAAWDGKLDAEDAYNVIHVESINTSVHGFFGNVSIMKPEVISNPTETSMQPIIISSISPSFTSFYGRSEFVQIIKSFTIGPNELNKGDYDEKYVKVSSNNEYMLNDTYQFAGTAEAIDDGYLESVSIDTDEYETIESVGEA